METWPVTLPQEFDVESLSVSSPDYLIQSKTDSGMPKVRKRFTRGLTTIKGKMELFTEEIQILQNFYEILLNSGTEQFVFPRPAYLSGTMIVRFKSQPEFTHRGANVFSATIELQTLDSFWSG